MGLNTDAVESTARAVERLRGRHAPPIREHKPAFRPDIEGVRTIAVGLVLAYHGFAKPFVGGFVGVDVFFVISGFLITSLLLREQTKTGRVFILGFYARRARRILPASAAVVVLTLVASYYFLGLVAGNQIAEDAKWTSIFAANIHFGLLGTDYLGAQLPPSPLQHMWSLGVEEQFYVVWPGLFLLLMLLVRGPRHRATTAGILGAIIAASLTLSITQTMTNATWAYFSPWTRAWELALGALVAVSTPWIAKVKLTWICELAAAVGLAGIFVSALLIDSKTPFPGSSVAWPVVSTGLLIAAGCTAHTTMVGRVLSVRPMQWFGARSYSLYLWHWPLLTIAAQYAGHDLSVLQNAGLLAASVIGAALSYRLIENPIRRSTFLGPRTGLSLLMGLAIIIATIAFAQYLIAVHYGSWNPLVQTGIQ